MKKRHLMAVPLAVMLAFSATSAGAVSGAAPAAPHDAPAPQDEQPALQTGFERSKGAQWTSESEERDFLAELDEKSERVAVSEVGRSVQDRPIRLIRMGSPAPADAAQGSSGSVILFVCSQHGDEPAGREACLKRSRDLAFSQDPADVKLLSENTVLFVPTANPDGRALNQRTNASGVDINRDHLELKTPEAQTMARVFRAWKPDLIHDLHEYSGTAGVYDKDLTYLWPRNLNVDEGVHGHSRVLNEQYISSDLRENDFSTGEYGIWTKNGKPIAQSAGDGQERILRNMAGLRHSMGTLVESLEGPRNDAEKNDASLLHNRRVDEHVIGVGASLRMFDDKRAAIGEATAAAARKAATRWADGTDAFFFGGADNALPAPDRVALTAPCAYTLTAAQLKSVETALDLHGVAAKPDGSGGATVSMAQPSAPVIPLLLDKRATYKLTEAQPVTNCTS